MRRYRYLLTAFIFKIFDARYRWEFKKMVSYYEMRSIIEDHYGKLERVNRGKSEVAKDFRIPGFEGEVSFITSMTENFCGGCSRLRLLADGNLKVMDNTQFVFLPPILL